MAFTLSSSTFTAGGRIPKQCTCDGADVSPALSWSGAPDGTTAFALIADDPDAPGGTWVHWVLYNVPAGTSELRQGTPTDATLPGGARQGVNDFRRTGYAGPCPPPGKPHRYVFTLYALDARADLAADARKPDVLRAIAGHVLAQTQLTGTYGR